MTCGKPNISRYNADVSPNNQPMLNQQPVVSRCREENYKKYLPNARPNQWNNGTSLQPFEFTWPSSISAAVAIIGGAIALSNPVSGFAVTAIGTIIPLLWPASNPDTPKPEYTWKSFTRHVESLIDQNISTVVEDIASASLNGLRAVIFEYQEAFTHWKNNPSEINRRNVANKLNGALTISAAAIPSFAVKNYEVLLLPIYAQAANLHLLLIRDSIIFANEWQMARDNGDFHYQQLLKYTDTYVSHCIRWYKSGLEIFTFPQTDARTWKRMNNYRRDMTLMVLDLISFFSGYNPRLYPPKADTNAFPKTELTREIYTGPLNNGIFIINDSDLDARFTRKPHLFSWIRGIEFWFNSNSNRPILIAHKTSFSFTGNDIILGGHTYGPWNYPQNSRHVVNILDDTYIFSIATENFRTINLGAINTMVFNITINNSSAPVRFTAGSTNFPLIPETLQLPPRIENAEQTLFRDYSHILSYITSQNNSTQFQEHVFAWTHHSVSPHNSISTDTITSIPAVKATSHGSGDTVISGPGHTGGDLVKLVNRLDMQVQISDNQTYRIRIRYAAITENRLAIRTKNQLSVAYIRPTIMVPDFQYDNLRYKDFSYIDIPHMSLRGTGNQFQEHLIVIENWGPDSNTNPPIIIDSIEFIPEGFNPIPS